MTGQLADVLAAVLTRIAERPVQVGVTVSAAVTLMYFGSNALWYQPHAHESAFFSTRNHEFRAYETASGNDILGSADKPATRIILEKPGDDRPVEFAGDPTVKTVQQILSDLDLYDGNVDGLNGPQTRQAVETYRKVMKLPASGEIDAELLSYLGADSDIQPDITPPPLNIETQVEQILTSSIPIPTPRESVLKERKAEIGKSDLTPSKAPADGKAVGEEAKEHVLAVKIQAGLREFGNDAIQLDGKVGARTTAAIREFQTLFGLPVTGKIDNDLVSKMAEIGLISL